MVVAVGMQGETLPSFQHAQALVKEAIDIYNHERLHTSLGYVTPASKHAAETRYPLIHKRKKKEKQLLLNLSPYF